MLNRILNQQMLKYPQFCQFFSLKMIPAVTEVFLARINVKLIFKALF